MAVFLLIFQLKEKKMPLSRFITLVISILIIAGVTNVYAESGNIKKNSWKLGTEVSHIRYEEEGIMENEGVMYGITGSYTYRGRDKLILRTEGRYSFGEVDYSSENTGSMDNVKDYLFNIKQLGGCSYTLKSGIKIVPYFGIGYRYLNDDSSGRTTTTGAKGYERESNYFYSPVGIKTVKKLHIGGELILTIEYDHFWKGIQKSHLSDADPNYNDLENDQNSGYGLRGSVEFYKKSEMANWSLEAFIRYWDIDKSEEQAVSYNNVIINYGYEPANTTTEIGLEASLKF